MLIRKAPDIRTSDITPKAVYLRRREFIQAASGAAVAAAAALAPPAARWASAQTGQKLANVKKSPLSTTDQPNRFEDITSYNNFYEFGTDKESPAQNSKRFKARPWKVAVEGLVAKPAVYDIDEFLKPYTLEERVYRLRCVEAWSMIVPWIGVPFAPIAAVRAPVNVKLPREFCVECVLFLVSCASAPKRRLCLPRFQFRPSVSRTVWLRVCDQLSLKFRKSFPCLPT